MHMHVGSISIFLMALARRELKILGVMKGCERFLFKKKLDNLLEKGHPKKFWSELGVMFGQYADISTSQLFSSPKLLLQFLRKTR